MSVSADLDILAKTIVAEAGGEPYGGQLAVAHVVVNRSRLRRLSIRDVCLQPWQFSCWNQDSKTANPTLLRRMAACSVDTSPEYLRALGVAATVMSQAVADTTGSATHYHTIAKPSGAQTWPPKWANAPTMIPTARIGAHAFYREE